MTSRRSLHTDLQINLNVMSLNHPLTHAKNSRRANKKEVLNYAKRHDPNALLHSGANNTDVYSRQKL